MKFNKGRSVLGALLFTLTLGTISASNAAVIYDNGTPNTDNGYPIGSSNTADDFSISSGGTVQSVGFYFQNYNGITGWDQQVTYSFLTDASGLPGMVLATDSAQNVTATISSYAWCCGGGNAWLVEFDLASDFVAVAGTTYWLQLSGAGGSSPWWVTSGPGNSVINGSTVYGQDMAFSLIGSDGQTVPEPTSLALAGIGLTGLAFARRRKPA